MSSLWFHWWIKWNFHFRNVFPEYPLSCFQKWLCSSYFHQQCAGVLFSSCHCRLPFLCLTIAILREWGDVIVSVCISLVISDIEYFSCTCLPLVCSRWKICIQIFCLFLIRFLYTVGALCLVWILAPHQMARIPVLYSILETNLSCCWFFRTEMSCDFPTPFLLFFSVLCVSQAFFSKSNIPLCFLLGFLWFPIW